jgi:CRP-like cAMP-binding protein
MDGVANGLDIVFRRLGVMARLDESDRMLLFDLIGTKAGHRPGATMFKDGDQGFQFLISGWACRVCPTPWGGRQIVDVLLPGDAIGHGREAHAGSLCRVIALTHSVTVDAAAFAGTLRGDDPAGARLRAAGLAAERADASRLRDQAIRLGAPTAYQAICNLLLELRRRLDEVGLVDGLRWPMELTQETLAQTLGVGSAQINRVLGKLRRERLVLVERHWIQTPDLKGLAAAAGHKVHG